MVEELEVDRNNPALPKKVAWRIIIKRLDSEHWRPKSVQALDACTIWQCTWWWWYVCVYSCLSLSESVSICVGRWVDWCVCARVRLHAYLCISIWSESLSLYVCVCMHACLHDLKYLISSVISNIRFAAVKFCHNL